MYSDVRAEALPTSSRVAARRATASAQPRAGPPRPEAEATRLTEPPEVKWPRRVPEAPQGRRRWRVPEAPQVRWGQRVAEAPEVRWSQWVTRHRERGET